MGDHTDDSRRNHVTLEEMAEKTGVRTRAVDKYKPSLRLRANWIKFRVIQFKNKPINQILISLSRRKIIDCFNENITKMSQLKKYSNLEKSQLTLLFELDNDEESVSIIKLGASKNRLSIHHYFLQR